MHEEELHFLNFSGMIAGACQEFLIGRTISFENDLRCCPVQTGRHTMIITHFGPILYLLLLALIVLFCCSVLAEGTWPVIRRHPRKNRT